MTTIELTQMANLVADIVLARLEPKSKECDWREACRILNCSRRKLGRIVADNPSVKVGARSYSRVWLNQIKAAR